jgi:hypothetical protein
MWWPRCARAWATAAKGGSSDGSRVQDDVLVLQSVFEVALALPADRSPKAATPTFLDLVAAMYPVPNPRLPVNGVCGELGDGAIVEQRSVPYGGEPGDLAVRPEVERCRAAGDWPALRLPFVSAALIGADDMPDRCSRVGQARCR